MAVGSHRIGREGREEADALGMCELPPACLYGINTARALQNFPFPGPRLGDECAFVRALAAIKKAAAQANCDLGALSEVSAGVLIRPRSKNSATCFCPKPSISKASRLTK